MRRIPTRYPWSIPENNIDCYSSIKYDGNIFIILLDNIGNHADFQYDGVSCLHKRIRGFIFKSFKSRSKWFKPSWWYNKTCWGNYGKSVYFHKDNPKQSIYPSLNISIPVGDKRTAEVNRQFEYFDTKSQELASKYAIPAIDILRKIMIQVYIGTGINFNLDFMNTDYGVEWYEAYIPLEYKGKKYLLTWENCD